MKEKTLWKILLVLGFLPFVFALFSGIYAAITGFSGLSILGSASYGLEAFVDWIVLYSFVYWPTYIIGLILIVFSIFKLKK